MIEAILPAGVVCAEAREGEPPPLHPEEEALVSRAVAKRRREFAAGRACAREALGALGVPPAPILSGARGEPLWPEGIVGSITHCDGYRACAAARQREMLSVAIDAEPHAPLPEGLLPDIARPEERPHLAELARADPAIHWDKLLFSAKESVYKAWYPLAERWLGFEDAVLSIDPNAGTFSARLLVGGSLAGEARLGGFEGRWAVGDGLVATAIALPR